MNAKWVHRAVLLVVLGMTFPVASFAGFFNVGITVGFAPPALPVYVQPPCPASGYLWTPGYWAYSDDDGDYYWVPGTWVAAPSPGLLWTPGYWAAADEEYVWHPGYWASHVGFYGGINYGFGYFGVGYAGGYWRDHDFYYNRAVTNITNVNITNVYNRTVINDRYGGTRASFNGGDGIRARPTPGELMAEREPHRGFTQSQRLQAESARTVPSLLASLNHGRPTIGATARPGDLHGRGMAAASRVTASPRPGAPQYAATSRATNASQSAAASRVAAPPRPAGASQYPGAPRATAAPGREFASRNVAPAKPLAPVPSAWRTESHAPADRGSPPVYRPASPNMQSPHIGQGAPHFAQGDRFDQSYAAQAPRNETPRSMSMQSRPTAMPLRPMMPQSRPMAMQSRPTAMPLRPMMPQSRPMAMQSRPMAAPPRPMSTQPQPMAMPRNVSPPRMTSAPQARDHRRA